MGNFAFNSTPLIRHNRSRFDLSHGVKTSANVGTLYPFEIQEVYPGDTFKVRTSVVSRLSSQFLRPVMDNLFLDQYWFFVPDRILYDKFVNVFGENTESAWANTEVYQTPQIPQGQICVEKTVGDYLGLPINTQLPASSILPFRAFAKIYDDWFRDQNNVNPMHIQKGEFTSSEALNNQPWGPNNYTGQLPKVAKFHDYFTSLLPSPQKGETPNLPLLGSAPVVTGEDDVPQTVSLRWQRVTTGSGSSTVPLLVGATFSSGSSGTVSDPSSIYNTGASPGGASGYVAPANLYADLTQAGAPSVNDLRFAFQFQKMLERDARSGTRFVEYLSAHFGVSAGDYRLQRSEFLGGRRAPISIHQVVQSTGSGSDSSPLGEVGAYSLSNSRSRFTKSFTEHGFVIGVCCIRQHHTYQQGVERFWRRSKRTDYFDPVFSHIGEQPVYVTELFASAPSDMVMGYNEAWADLRYRPNRVTGQMRTNATDSLHVWHFADWYENAPTLNEQFIEETPDYVDRAITVESSAQDQFILDFWVQNIAYRVLPTYSVPSLIDHD